MPEEKLAGGISFDIGEAERNIKRLNSDMRMIESSFKATSAALGDWSKSIDGNQSRIQALTGTIEKQGQKLQELYAIRDKQKDMYGEESKQVQDTTIRINGQVAALNRNKAELEQVTKQMSALERGQSEAAKSARKLQTEIDKTNERLKTTQAELDAASDDLQRGWSAEGFKKAQDAMQRAVEQTKERLEQLKQKQREMETVGVTDATQKEYEELKREIITAEQASKQLNSSLVQLNSIRLDQIGTGVEKAGRSMLIVSAAIAAGAGLAAKANIEWESAFAGVRKTVNATEEELDDLAVGIRGLAKEIPVSAAGLAAIAENAGQLGIKTQNIMSFTKVMADLGVATNLSGEEAAQTFAKFANITQMPQEDFGRLGSTIVELGNNLATTESDISAMVLNLASAGKQAGMSEAQIVGLAAALSSVGLEAQMGGTAFSKTINQMLVAVETGSDDLKDFAKVAGMSSKAFVDLFKKDSAEAIVRFTEGLGDVGRHGKSAVVLLEEMGLTETRLSDALRRAAGSGDLFRNSIAMGTQAWSENLALTKEAETRYTTTESQIQLMQNTLTEAAITLSKDVLPMLNGLASGVKDVAEWFANLSDDAKGFILKALGLTAAVGPMLLILGKGITAFNEIRKAIQAATMAQQAFNLAEKSSAIGLIAVGVATVGAAIWQTVESMSNAASETEQLTERLNAATDAWDKQDQLSKQITKYNQLKKELENTGTSAGEAAKKQEELNTTRQWIIDNSDIMISTEEDMAGAFDRQVTSLEKLNKAEKDRAAAKIAADLSGRGASIESDIQKVRDLAQEKSNLYALEERQNLALAELRTKQAEAQAIWSKGEAQTAEDIARMNQLVEESKTLMSVFGTDLIDIFDLVNSDFFELSDQIAQTGNSIKGTDTKISDLQTGLLALGDAIDQGVKAGLPVAIELQKKYGAAIENATASAKKNAEAESKNNEELQDRSKNTDIVSEKTEDMADTSTTAADTIRKGIDGISATYSDLNGVLVDLSEGQELSAQQILDLVSKYPQLADALDTTSGALQFNKGAVEELMRAQIDAEITAINSEISRAQATADATRSIVANYESQTEAMKLLAGAGMMGDLNPETASAAAKAADAEARQRLSQLNAQKAALEKLKGEIGSAPKKRSSSGGGAKSKGKAEKKEDPAIEQYKKDMESLDEARKLDKISDADYYDGMRASRNKYLKENTKEWKDSTLSLYEWEKKQRQAAYENQKDDLRRKSEYGLIDQKEYLKGLERLRDEYFSGNAEEWQKATDEILSIQASGLKDFSSQWQREVDALTSKYDSMTSKLRGTGALFEEKDDTFRLRDLQPDIDMISKYGDALEKLKEREVPKGLLDEIQNMSTENGLKYSESLLKMSDTQYEKYITTWEAKQKAAADVAAKFYQSELDALKTQFTDKLTDEFAGLRDQMKDIGSDSAQGIAEGFKGQAAFISQTMIGVMNKAIAEAQAALKIHSPSKVTGDEIGAPVIMGINKRMIDLLPTLKGTMSRVAGVLGTAPAPAPQIGDVDKLNAINGMIRSATQSISLTQGGGNTIELILDGEALARAEIPHLQRVSKRLDVKITGV